MPHSRRLEPRSLRTTEPSNVVRELLPMVAVAFAFATAWFVVLGPRVRSVELQIAERRAAIAAFEGLADRLARARGLDSPRREVELQGVTAALAELRVLWSSAAISNELIPVVDVRPTGPVLLLAEVEDTAESLR